MAFIRCGIVQVKELQPMPIALYGGSHAGVLHMLDTWLPDWLISDSELVCEVLCREALRPDIIITSAQPPLSSQPNIHMHDSGLVCSSAGERL